jgi:hypothetical protein
MLAAAFTFNGSPHVVRDNKQLSLAMSTGNRLNGSTYWYARPCNGSKHTGGSTGADHARLGMIIFNSKGP